MDFNVIFGAVIENVVQILVAALLSTVLIGLRYIRDLVTEKLKMQNLAGALRELDSAVINTVGELQQTVVDGLKAASADGKLTEDEVKMIGEKLIAGVKDKLSAPAANIINAAGVDIVAYMRGVAEAYLHDIKVENAAKV